jgi:hypothetical protein
MSLIDDLIRIVRTPLEFVRHRIWGVRNIEGRARGDWNRVRALRGEFGSELKQNADAARGLGQQAKSLGQKAGGLKRDPVVSWPSKKSGKKRKKMGLFSKKKKCSHCGEKLHVSWDLCPTCGLYAGTLAVASSRTQAVGAAPAADGAKGRTLAIDLSSEDGGAGGIGWLVPLEGSQTGELFQLAGRCIVGTAADCDVVLHDPSISSRHAELIISGANCRISDLGSTNGTFVNDKRVTTSDLIDNDSVRLGQTPFKFKAMS